MSQSGPELCVAEARFELFFTLIHFVCVCVCTYMPWWMCGNRDNLESIPSSTVWIQEFELRSSGSGEIPLSTRPRLFIFDPPSSASEYLALHVTVMPPPVWYNLFLCFFFFFC